MANLDLIKRLNEKYDKASPIRRQTKLFAISEAIDPNKIEKALPDSLASMGIEYTKYFELGLPADVVLLFVDVCGFSTRYSDLSGEEVSTFFDKYYDIVIPILYKYKGEVDKVIGDGIICVFGPPFDNSTFDQIVKKANTCAKEIISATKGTAFSSKIAFHCGRINYFKNKTGLYKEFTLVGRPLTELFRLESVSLNERINYYEGTPIRLYYESLINNRSASAHDSKPEWLHNAHKLPTLNGVNYNMYYSIRKV